MKVVYFRTVSGRQPVEEYIRRFSEDDRAKVSKDIVLIERYGLDAPVPFRHIGGKLWEMKTGRGKQQRIFFIIIAGPMMVLLHACKKQKTGSQHEDVAVAAHRMKEVQS